jgi:DNA-binding response OmpR family regulator
MRIGIVEDDASLAQELLELLTGEGHRCYMHRSGESLISFLSHETVDVLLLDWEAGGSPTSDVVRRIRSENPRHLPILVLITRFADQDIIPALRAGVDGYAAKPLQPAVLLARIEALYERWYPKAPRARVERYGDYEFDTGLEIVFLRGASIQLTAKEFGIAVMLFRNQDRTLSRSYIFESLWGSDPEMRTRTVDSHISKVRTKLDLRGAHGFRLVPVYGLGYRLESIGLLDAFESTEKRVGG